ncbi:MAG: DUF342 domain-containing protein [Deltaproteobacteria bacterium]|nr:DUF342 domain-containing protein [Deltaproteobacteria bacterium]
MKYRVRIKSKNRNDAIAEGAERLGVDPANVFTLEESPENWVVIINDAPGEYELEIRDDKMSAILRDVTPPAGNGRPVTNEDIEKTLSDMGVIHGIEKDAIKKVIEELNATGKLQGSVIVAKGDPPQKGEKAQIDLKIGRDAPNKEPKASVIVKPGQVIAIKTPAHSGAPGKNIFGEDVPSLPGDDISFLPGENIALKNRETEYVSVVYGVARSTWQGGSVTDLVTVSKDKMYVEMPLYPSLADNSRLTLDDIASILKSKGIKYGINNASIKAALEKGEPVDNFRVAEATPAKNGIDSKMEFLFRVNGLDPEEAAQKKAGGVIPDIETRDIVLGGEILARKIPSVKQEDGKSVTGEVIKAVKPEECKVKTGDNVEIRENGLVFVVSQGITAGYAEYSGDTISVVNPLEISEDRLSASIMLYSPSSKKRFITGEQIREIIERAGIRFGITLDEVEGFLSSDGKKAFPPKKIIVAKGIATVHGEDAKISIKFSRDKEAGHLDSDTGRMDFREQSFIHNVKKDDLLAEKIPLTAGADGKNIFGEIIPATPGKDCKLLFGTNVILSPDGRTLISGMDGMVAIQEGNRISVTQSHEIQGDIDMNTGNLTMDGSLVIKGWVSSGFSARASGEIHIGKGVEQATVDAGAGLFIHGGIVGGDNANITSGGGLTAFFIENTKVLTKGDIHIRDDIRNSIVSSGGVIDATSGKGRLIGGTVAALKEIKANEAGSPAGVKTNIIVGINPEQAETKEKITQRLEDFKHQMAKIDIILVRFKNKNGDAGIPKEMRFKLDKLIKQRRSIVQMEAKLNDYMAELHKKEMDEESHSPSLTINRMVFAGTRVTIKGSFMDVENDMPGKTRFHLDSRNQIICN